MTIRKMITMDSKEIGIILKEYLSQKGLNNISSLKVTIGGNSYDFIKNEGYLGTKLEAEIISYEEL